MMPLSGSMAYGFPLEIFLMWASGAFYALCALFIVKSVRQEHNELIRALFAFLIYQAVAMLFMGMGWYTHNLFYDNIGSLAILVGSVYMLKFPFSLLGDRVKHILFYVTMLVILVAFAYFMTTEALQILLMKYAVWYDVGVNGLVVGFFIFLTALRSRERWYRVKALGGGTGVVSCCVAGNIAMISGAFIVSAVFQFLAPIIIIFSLFTGRKLQRAASVTPSV